MTQIEGQTQSAYARIRQSIVEGRHAPGTRLVEQRLAEELSLSRTPVREALKMLEAEGLVVIERNVGAVVRHLDRQTITDLYDLRARLESFGANRAATRRTTAHIVLLQNAVVGFDEAIAAVDMPPLDRIREINRWNSEFHATVLDAANHERLSSMLGRLVDVPLVFQSFRRFDHAQLQRSLLFHQLIDEAIEGGDGGRAERLMLEHIDQGRDVLLAAVDDLESVDALFAAG